MKLFDFLKYDEDLTLQKKTVVILRWIALIGQLITIYVVHFLIRTKSSNNFMFNNYFLRRDLQIFLYNFHLKKTN